MIVGIIKREKDWWLLEATDGRRFVLSGKKDIKVCPEGSDVPIIRGKGIPYKTAINMLQDELSEVR